MMHSRLETDEGFYSVGLQDGPCAFAERAGDVGELVAPAAGQVGVAEIQFDDRSLALADEGKAEIAEAGFDGLESECLGAACVGEFHRIAGQPDAGQIRIPKTDIGGAVGFVVAGDVQLVDVDLRQLLSDRARVAAMGIAPGQ